MKVDITKYTEVMVVDETLKWMVLGQIHSNTLMVEYLDKGILSGDGLSVSLIYTPRDFTGKPYETSYCVGSAYFNTFPAFGKAVVCSGVSKTATSGMVKDFSKRFIDAKAELCKSLGYAIMFCTVNNGNVVGIINAYKSGYKCIQEKILYTSEYGTNEIVSLWMKYLK